MNKAKKALNIAKSYERKIVKAFGDEHMQLGKEDTGLNQTIQVGRNGDKCGFTIKVFTKWHKSKKVCNCNYCNGKLPLYKRKAFVMGTYPIPHNLTPNITHIDKKDYDLIYNWIEINKDALLQTWYGCEKKFEFDGEADYDYSLIHNAKKVSMIE